jgi:hypothetical protein
MVRVIVRGTVMKSMAWVQSLLMLLFIALLSECSSGAGNPAPLSSANVNLIFVVSEDLAYNAAGDINPNTANLTSQGLQRSLLMATFLKQQVLGSKNVTAVFALEPMTHLQTANNYPDMAALETIQQFALLNQITLLSNADGGTPVDANSYPINATYADGGIPSGVAQEQTICKGCRGLDFTDHDGNNESLAGAVIQANLPGFYVFSAPWETVSSMMGKINTLKGYNLTPPANYQGPNYIYAISIPPSGGATLVTYNSNVNPSSTYPELPQPVPLSTTCKGQPPFSITVTASTAGAVIPQGINTNSTFYMVRHAEAHPGVFDNGNYVCAGQWRALDLPNALRGKINPDLVYAADPSVVIKGTVSSSGESKWSYVRPALTVAPYAIANNLPLDLAASFWIFAQNAPTLCTEAGKYFFTGGKFSNHKVLLGWEHSHFPPTVNALLESYFPNGGAPVAPDWPSLDYDTIWTVTLDASGNLTVDNSLCEGIDSTTLPPTCPVF